MEFTQFTLVGANYNVERLRWWKRNWCGLHEVAIYHVVALDAYWTKYTRYAARCGNCIHDANMGVRFV